jgi:uncharacterized protein (DUF924 family)
MMSLLTPCMVHVLPESGVILLCSTMASELSVIFTSRQTMEPMEIIEYWFSDSMKKHWFSSTPARDEEIIEKYEQVWIDASLGEYDQWKTTPEGCLALAIVLDQFPLNMYRGKPKSFSTESKAIEVSLFGIESRFDMALAQAQVSFLIMPLMHSEDIKHQDLSVEFLYLFRWQRKNAIFACQQGRE